MWNRSRLSMLKLSEEKTSTPKNRHTLAQDEYLVCTVWEDQTNDGGSYCLTSLHVHWEKKPFTLLWETNCSCGTVMAGENGTLEFWNCSNLPGFLNKNPHSVWWSLWLRVFRFLHIPLHCLSKIHLLFLKSQQHARIKQCPTAPICQTSMCPQFCENKNGNLPTFENLGKKRLPTATALLVASLCGQKFRSTVVLHDASPEDFSCGKWMGSNRGEEAKLLQNILWHHLICFCQTAQV